MTSTIELDPSEEHQTIEGFGASGAWWAQDVGGWEEEVRDRVIRLLFDHDEGIGLSVYRYNIGAGSGKEIRDPWRRTETFEVTPGVYDWTRDRNAIWVAQAAHAAGVERFVAFANSPPARMTRSGLVSGAATDERGGWADLRVWMGDLPSTLTGLELSPRHTRSNLRPDMVDAFARYLVDIVRHLREVEGIPSVGSARSTSRNGPGAAATNRKAATIRQASVWQWPKRWSARASKAGWMSGSPWLSLGRGWVQGSICAGYWATPS